MTQVIFYDGGYRPLHHACLWGHLPIVQALLGLGADVTARTGDFFDETAMHCAARYSAPPAPLLIPRRSSAGMLVPL